jgi:hypothetical protein
LALLFARLFCVLTIIRPCAWQAMKEMKAAAAEVMGGLEQIRHVLGKCCAKTGG